MAIQDRNSKRITNDMRHKIEQNMYTALFGARLSEIEKDRVQLAEATYNHIYSDQDKAMMRNAPEGAFKYATMIRTEFDGWDQNLELSKAMPVFANHVNRRFEFAENHPLSRRFSIIQERSEQMQAEWHGIWSQAKVILKKATTIGNLLAVWPEVEPYLPYITVTKYPVALPIAPLNELIEQAQNKIPVTEKQ